MAILVLDVDGVVVLGHPEGGRWDKDLARDLGLDAEAVQTGFFQAHWPRIEIGEAALFDVLREVWPSLGGRGTPEEFVAYWFARDSRLNLDVLAEVDGWRAAGGQAFLATVQEHQRARYLWTDLALADHFDGLIYSADLGAKKPQPEFFERALQRLPVLTPGEIVFLDDRQDNVDIATEAGWQASLYTEPGDLRRALHAIRP